MAYKRNSPVLVIEGGTGALTFTAHGVMVGNSTSALAVTAAGTTGQVLTGVTGSDPVWASPSSSSISITGNSGGALTGNAFTFTGGTTGLTFAGATSTETLGGTLVVSNGGTGNTTFTAYSVVCAGTTATGIFQNVSGVGTSGQVLTSAGAGALPSWSPAATGSLTWSVITADQSAVATNAYVANKAGLLTLTLPVTAVVGDTVLIAGMNTALGWKIAQNAGQLIRFGTSTTTTGTGGSLASTQTFDTIVVTCIVTNTTWLAYNAVGNITVV